jgi:Ser/Thr protein kinase RdoA (MazF antagonist)
VRISRYQELPDVIRTGRIADQLARTVPEVVAPLTDSAAETAFQWEGRPVSVWPFVEGRELDRHDAELIKQAARLLARLHRAGTGRPDDTGHRGIPGEGNAEAAAKLVPDRELDDWLRAWRDAASRDDPHGVMHGDFFWRNILCRDGSIVALIDWEEAWRGSFIIELAWSIWEFGKSPEGDALLPDRATEFLTAYRQAGGPAQPSSDLIPIVRERLRRDIAFFRWTASMGHKIDSVDEQAKFDAFASLAHVTVDV